jgi:hypothetical protein
MALRKTVIGVMYFATIVSLLLYLALTFSVGTAYAFSPWWVYEALGITFIFQVIATIQQFKRREWLVIPAVIVSIILTILILISYNFGSIFF